jgi:hypothetical protein
MKIGLSLSACVADIVVDRVKIEDVAVIVTNTAHDMRRSTGFMDVHAALCDSRSECKRYPTITWSVLQQLGDRIVQPRLLDPKHGHKSEPHWIDVPSH